jgi:uracil-DNA glycosylase
MTDLSGTLEQHLQDLRACRRCSQMQPPPVTGNAVYSPVMLVGQAPGDKEPVMLRPFAWTAGKTLFKWFYENCALDETAFRRNIYMSAVCRCFPGKKPKGGDRVPNHAEIANCSRWLSAEINLLKPQLVIPVGRLAIGRFMTYCSLEQHIGSCFRCVYAGHEFDAIPLPHPSGASPWPRMEPGKTLLQQALALIAAHPAMHALALTLPPASVQIEDSR